MNRRKLIKGLAASPLALVPLAVVQMDPKVRAAIEHDLQVMRERRLGKGAD